MQQWPVGIVYPGTACYIPWDVAAWGVWGEAQGSPLIGVTLESRVGGGLRQLLARCPVSPFPLQTGSSGAEGGG